MEHQQVPSPEKSAQDALRVQVAAVAAQQVALAEEENRLDQRRLALERQEEQLAAHLDEKRKKLLELQEQVRDARAALREERAAQEQLTAEMAQQRQGERHELAIGWKDLQTERKRLDLLRQRLRQRWQRQCKQEQDRLQGQADQIAGERRTLERDAEHLQREKETFVQIRLCANGEIELGRRQLQDARNELEREQRFWQDCQAAEHAALRQQAQDLDRREAALRTRQSEVHDHQRHWESVRLHLEMEAEGLENRVRNLRVKLAEHEQQSGRREDSIRELQGRLEQSPSPLPFDEGLFASARLIGLEDLAGALADQRLHLAEQCAQLLRAEDRWQQDRAVVLADLEATTRQLREQEQELEQREQSIQEREQSGKRQEALLRQRQEEARERMVRLDARQAQLLNREKTWEGERDRLHVQLLAGEDLVRQEMVAVAKLRQRWAQRRRQEVEHLRVEHDHCRAARARFVALWEEYQRRGAKLEQDQRALAERGLAMEQYRLECINRAPDSVAAERRLERLQRRCAAVSEAAARQLAQERAALQAEAEQLQARAEVLEREAAALLRREAKMTARQNAWEHDHHFTSDADLRLRQELKSQHAQRELVERQLRAVQEELERVARSLLESGDEERALAA